MKKLVEFLGKLLFVLSLIACPLLCGLSLVYGWGNGVIGVWLICFLIGEFIFLWNVVEKELEEG